MANHDDNGFNIYITAREQLIRELYDLGLTQTQMIYTLMSHNFKLSERQLRRILQKLSLARKDYSDIQEAVDFIQNELSCSGKRFIIIVMYRCRRSVVAYSFVIFITENMMEMVLLPDGPVCIQVVLQDHHLQPLKSKLKCLDS